MPFQPSGYDLPRKGRFIREMFHAVPVQAARESVNLKTGEILITETKGHKERIVVMSNDMTGLAASYARLRDAAFIFYSSHSSTSGIIRLKESQSIPADFTRFSGRRWI